MHKTKIAEELFLYVNNHRRKDVRKYTSVLANNFLSSLKNYEIMVSKEIRNKLYDFSKGKGLAEIVVRGK